MEMQSAKQLKVFYDGGCVVCNLEIDFYKRKDISQKIDWIDINQTGFDATLFGLHPMKVRERFHSITEDGTILDGVESFKTIWRVMGIWKPMVVFAEWKPSRMLLDLGYILFTKIRPYLPRRKDLECGDACVVDYSKTGT
jgi:predicted DCC family thiol-disulfide oxidoreductase YuxK